ncbi:MAG TPA: glycosyltransferase [Candidatus Baltobacteraceae bacterium]|nr:glycosyltransferase [Candidatus Baltobacteraceae bacterium]
MLLDYDLPLPRHSFGVGRVLLLSLHADPTTTVGAPENGGVTVYVRELARALAEEGWPVDVVTRRRDPDAPEREDRNGVNVIRIDAGPPKPLRNDDIAKYLNHAYDAVRALAAARTYRFVSSHYWLSGVVGDRIAREFSIPHVHTLHSHGVERKKRDDVTLERIEAERALLQRAKIATLSKEHVNIFRQKYGVDAQFNVVPAGVDTSRFRPGDRGAALSELGLGPERPWFGYVGRLAKEKGIDDLLGAFALLHARRPDAGLFVVGGASERSRIPELKQLAQRLHISEAVRFLGPIPNDRVPTAFQGADVLLVPSHYEAFGLVALEARATGVPVIASDVGGLRELVSAQTGGVRVPPKDYIAWAQEMERVLQPHVLRQRRALALREMRGDVYSWRTVANTIAGIACAQTHV